MCLQYFQQYTTLQLLIQAKHLSFFSRWGRYKRCCAPQHRRTFTNLSTHFWERIHSNGSVGWRRSFAHRNGRLRETTAKPG